MNLIKTDSLNITNILEKYIKKQEQGIFYGINNKKVVFVSNINLVNTNACNELNYKIIETLHKGGIIVANPGDITIACFGPIANTWVKDFGVYLVNYLKDQGLNAIFEGNDILIDGYKIAGLSAKIYGNIQYSNIHIGINTNLEDIKNICLKPMIKIPKGLSDYGFSTKEIEKIFINYYSNHRV